MQEILKIFEEIVKIPHCSGNTGKMREYLINKIKNNGYDYQIDKAGNILAFKNTPVLALQSHYDMVCVGDAPKIELVKEGDWLRAQHSSLGADNGMGVVIMLYLMKRYDNLEFLFTNDEEIGLIGAFNLDLEIKSTYLLNLDSEDENIYIGCAGGVDAEVEFKASKEKIKGFIGEVEVKNLPGGHSGVDIDKEIPNAIKVLCEKIENVVLIKGGERRNSIPASAKAKVVFENERGEEAEIYSKEFLAFLDKLPHGVLEWDFEFKVVSKSVNLALIENENITLSLRANSNEKLEELKEYIKAKCYGANLRFEGEYPAWKPEITTLARILKSIMKSEYKVIHAGLECAVLKSKFPNVSMASIGPIIENPHSINERVKLSSVEKILNVCIELIEKLKEDYE